MVPQAGCGSPDVVWHRTCTWCNTGVSTISRLQVWTQPLWLVMLVVPFVFVFALDSGAFGVLHYKSQRRKRKCYWFQSASIWCGTHGRDCPDDPNGRTGGLHFGFGSKDLRVIGSLFFLADIRIAKMGQWAVKLP